MHIDRGWKNHWSNAVFPNPGPWGPLSCMFSVLAGENTPGFNGCQCKVTYTRLMLRNLHSVSWVKAGLLSNKPFEYWSEFCSAEHCCCWFLSSLKCADLDVLKAVMEDLPPGPLSKNGGILNCIRGTKK